MKGIILAGGKGTRMAPLTNVVNKHLLPIGGKCMLHHCVDKLTEAGITDIMIVTGGEHLGGIAEYLGGGSRFDCRFTYRVQEAAGGIAQALSLAERFVGDENMCVILGDNIFKDSLKKHVHWFNTENYESEAMVMLKEVRDPGRFGVANVRLVYGKGKWNVKSLYHLREIKKGLCFGNGEEHVVGIEEKPKKPKSKFAVTGIYFYSSEVFDIIKTLKPSGRGELEITDVNNEFIRRKAMTCRFLDGWWTDAGTHESYRLANELVWSKSAAK